MDKINFLAGDEKRFFDFISKLNDKDKIMIAGHTDLDGLASVKVVNHSVKADSVQFFDFKDIRENFVNKIKEKRAKKLIFVDLNFGDPAMIRELEKFAEILIIDHHVFKEDLNSERTTFINAQGYCAAYICYYLFSKIQNLDKLDWLVAAASLSDLCYQKNKQWAENVCKKYGEYFSLDELTTKNKIYNLAQKLSLMIIYFKDKIKNAYNIITEDMDSLTAIDNYARDVQNEIDSSAEKFEKQKKIFGGIYYWEFKPEFMIRSHLITLLGLKYPDKIIIIAEKEGNHYNISARRQDKKVNLVELMQRLTEGFENHTAGGHIAAAGAVISENYIEEFKKRVAKLER